MAIPQLNRDAGNGLPNPALKLKGRVDSARSMVPLARSRLAELVELIAQRALYRASGCVEVVQVVIL
jgi:hypothetical protein